MLERPIVSAALMCLMVYSGHCEPGRYTTITITNQTPDVPIALFIEVTGKPLAPFKQRPGENVWEYRFPLKDSGWFNEADIKIIWKNAYVKGDASKKDFEQRISLRLRYDFPSDYDVPIYFSNDRSQAEMDRLEHLKDIHDQFEVFFRGGQIANFYAETTGRQHKFTQRAAKFFFWGAIRLAEYPDYFVIMSDEAEQMAQEAFGSTDFANRANLARSFSWEDARYVDSLVGQGKCEAARILLDALRGLAQDERGAKAFAIRHAKNPKILDEKEMIVAKCSPRTGPG
jgi:hypothetical protein